MGRKCNELLTNAELKITRLKSNFAEQMNLVPDEDIDADAFEDEEDED